MAQDKFRSNRQAGAASLRHLGNLLSSNAICYDVTPIVSAADQLLNDEPNGRGSWGYDIANLHFSLPNSHNFQPALSDNFAINLTILLRGRYECDPEDQFTRMEVNIEKYTSDSQGNRLKAAWHFDRHIFDTRVDTMDNDEHIHPLYHFQYGGARMESLSNLGDTFLMDPPRLMHPPMDGILFIDFLLANYFGKEWRKMRENSQYYNIISSQYRLLWKPYFESIAESWNTVRPSLSKFLCPFV